jgi:hypothetical protein
MSSTSSSSGSSSSSRPPAQTRNKYRMVQSLFLGLLLQQQHVLPCQARKTRLTWVNGIAHNLEHMEEGKVVISALFGKQVVYCYNPTAMTNDDDMMGYLGDLTQATQQKMGLITAEVNVLVKHLKEAVAAVGKRGRVIHIAHSQGALITFLAAKQLTAEEMSQIEVLAFGGAAALRRTVQTPFNRCVNYYSVNDPLLFVVPQAAQALRSGFVGDEEFCFLSPRIGDPIRDHNLIGPTYLQALTWEGSRFQQRHQSPAYRTMRTAWMFCRALYIVFAARLHAILKILLRPVLLWSLLVYMWTRHLVVKISNVAKTKQVIPTTVLFLSLLLEWIIVSIRNWTGVDEFVPVASFAEKNQDDASTTAVVAPNGSKENR